MLLILYCFAINSIELVWILDFKYIIIIIILLISNDNDNGNDKYFIKHEIYKVILSNNYLLNEYMQKTYNILYIY